MFKERFVKEGFIFDNVYDWVLRPIKYDRIDFIPKKPIFLDLWGTDEDIMKQINFLENTESSEEECEDI